MATFAWDESAHPRSKSGHFIKKGDIEDAKSDPEKAAKLREQVAPKDADKLDAYEARQLEKGYEGLILRSPDSPYKYGRSTVKEGYLLKVKRFTDGEAEVIGFEERMHNGNEATTDELGRTKRSSHAEGKTGRGDLGAFLVRDLKSGVEFSVGTGFTDEQRKDIWLQIQNPVPGTPDILGSIIKYKSFLIGVKDAPRFPVFLAFRNPDDMSE